MASVCLSVSLWVYISEHSLLALDLNELKFNYVITIYYENYLIENFVFRIYGLGIETQKRHPVTFIFWWIRSLNTKIKKIVQKQNNCFGSKFLITVLQQVKEQHATVHCCTQLFFLFFFLLCLVSVLSDLLTSDEILKNVPSLMLKKKVRYVDIKI